MLGIRLRGLRTLGHAERTQAIESNVDHSPEAALRAARRLGPDPAASSAAHGRAGRATLGKDGRIKGSLRIKKW